MTRLTGIALGSLLLCGAAFAQGAGADPQPQKRTPEQVWVSSCGYCHGGPMNAPQLRGRNLPPQIVIAIARNGANGMPPFHESELDDETLRALAQWVSESPVPADKPQQ